ncbi:MAG: MFS transporter [Chloroflexi bacterium]|nr:MFS transporter [Chloroflexota bacterium]
MSRALDLSRRYEPLLICAFFQMCIFLNWHLVLGVLPLYAMEFGVTLAAAGLLISAFTAARICLNFPAGVLIDRIGRKSLLLAGGMLTASGSLGSGLVVDFPALVVMRFITGAGGAIAIVAQMTIIADLSTAQNRGRLMSFNEGVIQTGTALGPGVGGIIAEAAGLRMPFYVVASLTLGLVVWALVRLPETGGRGVSLPCAPGGRSEGVRVGFQSGVNTLLRNRNYVMITLLAFGTFFTRFGTLFLLLPLVAYSDRIGLTLGQFGLMATAVAGVSALLLPVAGVLADRFGRKVLIVPSTILTGLALVFYGMAPTREWFFVAAGFYALAAGIQGPSPGAYLADVAPTHLRGLAMGGYRTFGDLAGVLAPLILGAVASSSSSLGVAVVGNGLLVILMGVCFAVFAEETLVQKPQPARTVAG